MTYDEQLAERVRGLVEGEPGLSEQRMFGGLAFLVGGHMTVAVSHEGGLLLRTTPEQAEELLDQPHTSPFVMRDRPMRGWLRVEPAGCAGDEALERWVGAALAFARTLPPKASSVQA